MEAPGGVPSGAAPTRTARLHDLLFIPLLFNVTDDMKQSDHARSDDATQPDEATFRADGVAPRADAGEMVEGGGPRNALRTVLALVAACALLVSTQGCDGLGNSFLEEAPTQDVTEETVFNDPDLAERFLTSTYRSLPYGPGGIPPRGHNSPYDKTKLNYDLLASLTDINQTFRGAGGAFSLYYTGTYSPTVAQTSAAQVKFNYLNSGAWGGIRDSYTFIENIDDVPGMSEELKAQRKAEARMIIALHYTDLFRAYGGVPWVGKALAPNDDIDIPRATAQATLDSTVAMIDRAIPDLPWTLPPDESGRMTRASAMGLKVRLLLFAASPLLNNSSPYLDGPAAEQEMSWLGGYDPQLWQRTADAAREMIEEMPSEYHLLDTGNPREDFQDAYYTRGSPEVLISTRITYRTPGSGNSANYFYRYLNFAGAASTTHNYVQMFPMADGTPIDADDSGYDEQNPYENRDPRLYETVLVNGDRYQSRTAELWIGGEERQSQGGGGAQSGYRMRKFLLDINNATNTVTHWPYLRLPEVYLSYAEALNEINGGPTSEAYEYVNRVRNRVGLDDLPSGMSQDEFREAVIRERALELGYEEVRWYDLIRHKRVEDLTKPLYGMNICKQGETDPSVCGAEDYGSQEFLYDRFQLPERYWQEQGESGWEPKWYMSAFPVDEVNKDYGLVQNPGW